MRKSSNRIPFSWTLLVISLLQFSVWSIGVSEAHSRDFFLRQQNSLKSCSVSRQTEIRKEIHCDQHLFRKFVQEKQPLAQAPVNEKVTSSFATTSAEKLTLFLVVITNNSETSNEAAAAQPSAAAVSFSPSSVLSNSFSPLSLSFSL